jgi:hypothetical protein
MIKLSGTFDIECAAWDQFRLGACYRGFAGSEKIFYDADEMIDYMRGHGGTWYGHAAGIYDSLLVVDRLTSRGIKFQADEAAQRITRLVCGALNLRDSYSLFPAPLDDLCGMINRPVPKLPWSCICSRDCGGYCQIPARTAAGKHDPDLEDYCVADCRDLYDGIAKLMERTAADGIDLRGTLGSTAWAHAKMRLGLPDAEFPSWDIWRRIRLADKPGRLFIIRPTADGPGSHSDIINAYPAALQRAELPVGECSEVGGRRAMGALVQALPGIYSATVRVPDDCFLPPLPWKIGGRTVYPTGTFSGTWCLPELAAAADRGVEILECHSAIIWEAAIPVFGDLMTELYALRKSAGKRTAYGQWLSRLAKALCGKLAEGPERSRVLAFPERVKLCTRDRGCRNGCTGRCRRYTPIDLFGRIWSAPYWKLPPSAHVHWSAYLRAHTRIQLLTEAERFGESDLVYGNTDSLWTIGRKLPSPIGDDLGHWERKHGWTQWQCRAPSVYRCISDDGTPIIRAAGSSAVTEADWLRGQGVIDRGVVTFRRAAKSTGKLFRRKDRRWTLPEIPSDGMYGCRRMDPSGVTIPLSAQEHRDRFQKSRASSAQGQNR